MSVNEEEVELEVVEFVVKLELYAEDDVPVPVADAAAAASVCC